MKTKVIVGLLLSMSLVACSDKPVPAVQTPTAAPVAAAGQPIIINQAPAASNNDGMLTGAVMGAAAGYMVGNSGNRNSGYDNRNYPQNKTTVINKTVVVKQYAQPKPVSTPPKKVSLTKSSSFGSFKSRRK